MTSGRVGLLILITGLVPGWLCAGEPPDPRRRRLLPATIKPVLSKRCYACHGALKQKAGLRLDTAALMKKGGDSGPAIEPGSSDDSLIIDAVTGSDGWRMPPESEGSPLSAERDRPTQGLDRPRGQEPSRRAAAARPAAALVVSAATAARRFLLRLHSGTPRNGSGTRSTRSWPRNIANTACKPRPAADPATLVRRVCLDLTGLVPSPEMVRAFVADPSDRSLRGTGRPAARQPGIRRALGTALDGRLALQRLGRLRCRGARKPAAYLAMARLDRRVAQSATCRTTA